jgi:NitT/TauT family transport system permease protein
MSPAAKNPLRVNGTVATAVWVAVLLAVWSLGTSYSLPSLGELPGAWWELVREEGLVYELGVSLKLNFVAMFLITVLSVGLAYLTVFEFFRPLVYMLTKFRFFSMAGFVIIFTRVCGGGFALEVTLLVFGVAPFFLTSMVDVVASRTQAEFDQTRSLRMSRMRAIWEIVILGRMDQTLDVLRQNAAMGWMMLTMVEGLSKYKGGVGVVMLNEGKYRNLAAIFAVQGTVLVLGAFGQDKFLGWLKNVCCPYAKLTLESK